MDLAHEDWKQVDGWPSYAISNLGRIWSEHSDRILVPVLNKRGYYCICLCDNGKQLTVWLHKLVLDAFRGPKLPGQQCRHLDGNKLNNHLDNLCWGTPKQNYEDQINHGSAIHFNQKGGFNHASKLNEQEVSRIRELAKTIPQKEIAKKFNVSAALICGIVSKKRWNHIK